MSHPDLPTTWRCPKCAADNGALDRVCASCGAKQPRGLKLAVPEPVAETEATPAFRAWQAAYKRQNLALTALGAAIGSLVAGSAYLFIGIRYPEIQFMVFVAIFAIFFGMVVGYPAQWLGKGLSARHGAIAAIFGLLASTFSITLIYTYFLAETEGENPASALLSGDFALYGRAFLTFQNPWDYIFILVTTFSAGWFGHCDRPGDDRLSILFGGR